MVAVGAGGWDLDFYDENRPFAAIGDLVPGAGDVWERAERNGARSGTPFFTGPDGRPDARINRFWRDPGIRARKEATIRRYAFSVKVWLNFLEACGVAWDQAGPECLAAFKDWRMSTDDNTAHVEAGSFRNDLTAIRRLYVWAGLTCHAIDNPVRVVVYGQTFWGEDKCRLEASPSAVRKADVKWLSPQAYRQWRNTGLRGFTAGGLPDDSWEGLNEDRDVAFADGLYGSGLRRGEWSSVLTVEVPEPGGRRWHRCWLAGACAKGKRGRPYWLPADAARKTWFYLHEGSRAAAVARAQRDGRYERVAGRWVLEAAHGDGALAFRDQAGDRRLVRLDSMTPRRRMKLFIQGEAGLEPLWLWLNQDGTPRPKDSWNRLFDRANARALRVLGADATGRPRLFARPHMLRHSYALRWYSILIFARWQETEELTEAERRDLRDELGSVWFMLASMLGHRSAETTKNVYLEPFTALQVEQLIELMEDGDKEALDQLAEMMGRTSPLVLAGVPA